MKAHRSLNAIILAALLLMVSLAPAQFLADAPRNPIRFANVDVLIDPHGADLAAYQLEFVADPQRVTLVGIEGGQHQAFKQPPYYDVKALSGNRVILAGLNAGKDLPREKTRVATLHLQIKGDAKPNLSAKLVVAASSNEKNIQADVTISEGATP